MARVMTSPTKYPQDHKRPLHRRGRYLAFCVIPFQFSVEVVAFQHPFPVTLGYAHTWKYPCLKAVATDERYPPVVDEPETGRHIAPEIATGYFFWF